MWCGGVTAHHYCGRVSSMGPWSHMSVKIPALVVSYVATCCYLCCYLVATMLQHHVAAPCCSTMLQHHVAAPCCSDLLTIIILFSLNFF